jgi:hypothetical protein
MSPKANAGGGEDLVALLEPFYVFANGFNLPG